MPFSDYEAILTTIITTIPATLFAAGAFYQARKTHESVNSRMTELLAITKSAATDAATLAEKAAEIARKLADKSSDAATLAIKAAEIARVLNEKKP